MKSHLQCLTAAVLVLAASAQEYTPTCDPARPSTYYVPHIYNCAQFFACSKGVPSPALTCPTNLVFHPTLGECREVSELPPDSECLKPPTSPTPPSSTPSTPSTPAPPTGVCHGLPAGTYVSDPEDCKKYYICLGNDEALESTCPGDLFFDPLNFKCVPEAQMPPDAPCLQKTCAGKPDGTYLAHPTDCKKYYVCLSGTSPEYTCPGDLYFHPERFQCVRAESLPPSSPCYPSAPWEPDCGGKPEGTYLEDPTDCTSYYICLSGSPENFNCPEPLLFHPTTYRCVPSAEMPENAQCFQGPGSTTVGPPSTTTSAPGPNVCGGQPDGALLPSPLTCQEYFRCMSGGEETRRCEDGTVFVPSRSGCWNPSELPANAECREGPVEKCKTDQDYTYYRDPFTCHGYYQCLNNVAARHFCPTYLTFHLKTGLCVWASELPVTDRCYAPVSEMEHADFLEHLVQDQDQNRLFELEPLIWEEDAFDLDSESEEINYLD